MFLYCKLFEYICNNVCHVGFSVLERCAYPCSALIQHIKSINGVTNLRRTEESHINEKEEYFSLENICTEGRMFCEILKNCKVALRRDIGLFSVVQQSPTAPVLRDCRVVCLLFFVGCFVWFFVCFKSPWLHCVYLEAGLHRCELAHSYPSRP